MSETEYVVKDLKIVHEGVFDFKEFYKLVKSWLTLRKYDLFEKEYRESQKEENIKEIKVGFAAEKVIDYYIKYLFDISLGVKDHKIVKGPKAQNLVQGTLTFKIDAKLQTDFEASWEGKPLLKFTRGIYDKFVKGDKYAEYKKELKDQTYELYNELKAYLNLHKF